MQDELDDDVPTGRVLSRKEAITLFGSVSLTGIVSNLLLGSGGGSGSAATSTTATVSSPTPAPSVSASASASPTPTPSASSSSGIAGCVATPELTEGPYWVDEKLNRSDVRSDPTTGAVKQGATLTLTLYLANVGAACGAISGATIDIWHCDAGGLYSDESANNTVGQKFLRGYQTTDANGMVQFTTIYPGWYSGRTVHIHFRVRFTANGTSYNFTSQLFFDDSLTDTVLAQPPYAAHGTRDTRNSSDNIYTSQMQMALTSSGSGYAGTFIIGIAA